MKCQKINSAVNYLKKNGYSIKEEVTGWSKMELVIYMDNKLTATVRNDLKAIDGLDYHKSDSDPHYAKEEVIFCRECKIAIAFPM